MNILNHKEILLFYSRGPFAATSTTSEKRRILLWFSTARPSGVKYIWSSLSDKQQKLVKVNC